MANKEELESLLDKILREPCTKGKFKGIPRQEALLRRYVEISTAEDDSGSREGTFIESVLMRTMGLGVSGKEKAKFLKDAAPKTVAIIANSLPELPDPQNRLPKILEGEVLLE